MGNFLRITRGVGEMLCFNDDEDDDHDGQWYKGSSRDDPCWT